MITSKKIPSMIATLFLACSLHMILSGCDNSGDSQRESEAMDQGLDITDMSNSEQEPDMSEVPDQPDMMTANGMDATLPMYSGEMISARDLAYPPPSGVMSDLAFLDVFRINDGERRPLVLLVHGGSWVGGDKEGFEMAFVPWWLERGFVAAPVNFRLASRLNQPRSVMPRDQARDIAASLAWLISQSDTYGIDTEKIVILGYSSGAHLVALLGTDESILREAGVDETKVAGVISFDVHAYDVPYALELMVGSVVEQNMPLIRHLFGDTEEEQLNSSPINYVDGWAAKSLIISVDEDIEEPGTHGYIVSKTAERYTEALNSAGHDAETFHDSQETHSSLVGGFGSVNDPVTEVVESFLDSINL